MNVCLARLFPLIIVLIGPARALDLQRTAILDQTSSVLSDGDIAINRVDRRLIYKKIDGSLGFGSLLHALPSGWKLVETGVADDVTVTPSTSPAANTLSRSLFESLRGTTFYLRPFLTDLTCTADQTANITAALALAPAGAEAILPPGCVRIAGTVTVTNRRLRGVGRSGVATEIRYSAGTGAAIKLMGNGTMVSDVLLTNRDASAVVVAHSTAVAIQYADGITNPRGQMVTRVRAVGFRDQIDVQSGEFWSASYLDFYNATRYGIRIRNLYGPDSGDGSIHASTIYADNPIGDTAIRLESGGGLKITATKTLQFNTSFALALAKGKSSSILMIDDSNSFENPRSSTAVRLGREDGATTGNFAHISIAAQLTGSVITNPGVENVRIATMTRDAPYGVIIQGGNNINVTSLTTLRGMAHGVVILNPATNVTVGQFTCPDCKQALEDKRTTNEGNLTRTETRSIDLPQSKTYTLLYQLDLKALNGASIEVAVNGVLQGKGAVNTRTMQLATRSNLGATMTQAALTSGGFPVDLNFDTTSVVGSVILGIRPNAAAGGGNLTGVVSIKVDGRIVGFRAL